MMKIENETEYETFDHLFRTIFKDAHTMHVLKNIFIRVKLKSRLTFSTKIYTEIFTDMRDFYKKVIGIAWPRVPFIRITNLLEARLMNKIRTYEKPLPD